jgi:hypothetical protein
VLDQLTQPRLVIRGDLLTSGPLLSLGAHPVTVSGNRLPAPGNPPGKGSDQLLRQLRWIFGDYYRNPVWL